MMQSACLFHHPWNWNTIIIIIIILIMTCCPRPTWVWSWGKKLKNKNQIENCVKGVQERIGIMECKQMTWTCLHHVRIETQIRRRKLHDLCYCNCNADSVHLNVNVTHEKLENSIKSVDMCKHWDVCTGRAWTGCPACGLSPCHQTSRRQICL